MNRLLAPASLRCAFVVTLLLSIGAMAVITPREAHADDLACGAVVTVDTVLDHDLAGCPQDGLLVGVDNITIDLNGHTIAGPGTADFRWDGIDNSAGHVGVTVRNGTIRDFSDGVYLDGGASNNRIMQLSVSDTFIGVEVVNGQGNLVMQNALSANTFGVAAARCC